MQNDDELRKSFQRDYDLALAATKRFFYLLPLTIFISVKLLEGVDKWWPASVGYSAIVVAFGLFIHFTKSKGMPVCPKCGVRQVNKGIPLERASVRSCHACGFLLLPSEPVKVMGSKKHFKGPVLWFHLGFALFGLIFLGYGYQRQDEMFMKVGGAFVVIPLLMQIAFLSRKPYCAFCGHLTSRWARHCSHCGKAKS